MGNEGFRRGVKEPQIHSSIMSSIITNSSAMIALETLRGVNKGMSLVQNQISTGQKVSSARDNAAVYAISTVMRSDVSSFGAISDSLSLGSATVGVARAASEQIVGLLTEAKTLIVMAQEDNVDRSKIDTDISALKSSIQSIVESAQFNGQNLLKGTGSIDVLATLNRDISGGVTAQSINVARTSLETSDATARTAISIGNAGFMTLGNTIIGPGGGSTTVTFTAGEISAGDEFSISLEVVGTVTANYTAQAGDTLADVGAALATSLGSPFGHGIGFTPNADPTGTDSVITIYNNSGTVSVLNGSTLTDDDATAGGLNGLKSLSVATKANSVSALGAIDSLITTAVDASAAFGSAQKSIDVQSEFVNSLMTSMEIGIGALIDMDMEEASARLQSLQVQQQLSVQALSIANQAPQSLLTLFR